MAMERPIRLTGLLLVLPLLLPPTAP